MTSDWSILDWARSKLSTDNFRSKQDVQTAIDDWAHNNAKDKGKSWDAFKEVVPNWFNQDSAAGVNLSDEVDEYNKTDIMAKVEKAEAPEDLKNLDLSEIRDDNVKAEVESAIKAKKEEVSVLRIEMGGEEFEIPTTFGRGRPREEVRITTQVLGGETFEQIVTATSKEELDEIEIPENIPNSMKAWLKREIREARKEL